MTCRQGRRVRASGDAYIKCIVVKVGGKRNTHKVCKKDVNFSKTEGTFFKVEGNNNFRETGESSKQEKLGEIRNLW